MDRLLKICGNILQTGKRRLGTILFSGNINKNNREVFSEIYHKNIWGFGAGGGIRFYSGKGSDDKYAEEYAGIIKDFIKKNKIGTAVDLGCGDYRVASRFAGKLDSYMGIDVVSELIQYNISQFAKNGVCFSCIDIVKDDLPDAQLCLIRQVLQHLSNEEIMCILRKVKKYPYVIVTEHQLNALKAPANIDKVHGAHTRLFFGSGVYLELPPFNCIIEKVYRLPYDDRSYLQVYQIQNL